MPACLFPNYGHSKVPPRTTSSLVIYERVISFAPTFKLSLTIYNCKQKFSWDVLSREGTMIRKYVDKCWTLHLWEFNDRYGLTVKQEDKSWLLPQCEHDQFIMEALTNLPEATSKRLRGAQCCSLFLQVTTLADITKSARTKLSEWVTNPRYSQPSQ
jgi:hypothetical protein